MDLLHWMLSELYKLQPTNVLFTDTLTMNHLESTKWCDNCHYIGNKDEFLRKDAQNKQNGGTYCLVVTHTNSTGCTLDECLIDRF